jgi:hypothetical protein
MQSTFAIELKHLETCGLLIVLAQLGVHHPSLRFFRVVWLFLDMYLHGQRAAPEALSFPH